MLLFTSMVVSFGLVLAIGCIGDSLFADELNTRFLEEAVTVTAVKPDLIVESIATNPVNPEPGETVNVTVTVRNQGAGDAANSFWVDFYKNRTTPPGIIPGDIDCFIAGLAAGATTTCTGTVSYATEGSYNMWAQVDTEQDVNETNEDNNIFGPQAIEVIGPCSPDSFEPDSTSGQASSLFPGVPQTHNICPVGDEDWYTFTILATSEVVLETSGPSGDTRMWLYDSGLTQVEFNDDGGAGLWSRIDRLCDTDALPPGTYYVQIDEFDDNLEIESYDISLTATPCPGLLPDLVVESIETDRVFASTGVPVNVTVTIRNQGVSPAGPFFVDFYQDRATPPPPFLPGDFDCDIAGLPAGAAMTCNGIATYLTAGVFQMWAQLDTDQEVDEINENNNILGPREICVIPSDQILNLVTRYYESILGRFPEPGGAESWTAEIQRTLALGIDVKEGFIALGKLFFNSEEYMSKETTNGEYIIDLYETFLGRTPAPGEVATWEAELAGGLPRNLLLNYFTFAEEFRVYMERIFGSCLTRPEYVLVNDLYRGFLARLPDDGGFNSWLTLMQEAQCTGEEAVLDVTNEIGLLFLQSAEYEARSRDNGEYITDLYDAILRRGAELAGYLAWLAELNAGMTREQALQHFVNSAEFQGRGQEVIDAGCILF
jgi:hypothetical protein